MFQDPHGALVCAGGELAALVLPLGSLAGQCLLLQLASGMFLSFVLDLIHCRLSWGTGLFLVWSLTKAIGF